MHITGSHHGLVELLAQFHDLLVDRNQIFIGSHRGIFIPDQEGIIPKRLDFQIIVEFHQPCNFLLRSRVQNGPVKFSRLTGGTDQQSIPVFDKFTLWNPRPSVIILDVGQRYQPVQIRSSLITGGQNDGMVGRHFLYVFHRGTAQGIDCIQCGDTAFL